MQKYIDDIMTWMTVNIHKLEDDKTKAMIVSSGRKSRSLSSSFPDSTAIGSASVPMSDFLENLVVTLHCHLIMKANISNLVCSANFDLCRISSILPSSVHKCHKNSCLCLSSFMPWLLQFSPVLLPSRYLLNKPQKVQNSALRFVLKVPHTDHVSPRLASLLQLSIYNEYSTNSILCTLYYNCLNSNASGNLTELLKVYKSTYQLCSSSYNLKKNPRMSGSIFAF